MSTINIDRLVKSVTTQKAGQWEIQVQVWDRKTLKYSLRSFWFTTMPVVNPIEGHHIDKIAVFPGQSQVVVWVTPNA